MKKGNKSSIFIIVWFFVIFGFFTASSTKLPTYIFPCFISLAIIVGVLLDDFLKKVSSGGYVTRGVTVSYYILSAVLLFGWVGAAIYAKLDFPSILSGVVVSGLFLAFGGLLSLVSFMRRAYLSAFALVVYSIMIFLCPLGAMILPEVERYETSKEVSAKLLAVMKPGEELGSASNYLAGLAFYTGKFPVDLDKHHVQTGFMNSEKRIWAVMKEKNRKHLYDPNITKTYVKPSYVIFEIGKRAIITNELPEDGRFLARGEKSK